jgi:hypothetical protein
MISGVSRYPANDAKFQLVRDLNLPLGHYAITSSGPMGVREIREIGDIDLVVDDDLWNSLRAAYPVTQEQGVTKIRERYSKPHVIEKKNSARAVSNASW